MTLPAVNMTELDGALGILPPSSGKLLVVAGPATSGTLNSPAAFGRVSSLVSAFGAGPMVELAAYALERFGRPVIALRTGATTAGAASAVTKTGTGTSVITCPTPTPNDDYELYFIVIAGGTIGTAGITFQWSLDGGRTLSPVTALGTANSFTFPGAGGVSFAFAAGTLVAGDTASAITTAPSPNGTDITTALTALQNSTLPWRMVYVCAPLDATLFDAIEARIVAMGSVGKYRSWMGSFRLPTGGETDATYQTAFGTALAAKSTVVGYVCAGSCEVVSSVSGRKYRRPVGHWVAPRQATASEEENIAVIPGGALVGGQIVDSNGNPKHHDEAVYPGLDDARAITLRTVEGRPGVYVTRPRVFSSSTSDFQIAPHREVMNLAKATIREMLIDRLNRPIRVNKTTGFILEADALEIEALGRGVLRTALLAKPKASSVEFTVARNDNLLSTKTLNTQTRIVPLAYPEFINAEVGYTNPALQVVAV